MQYWVFFSPGVGGDGFVNLLEHANNIKPADGNLMWRIHKKFSDRTKFFSPLWVESDTQPFREISFNETPDLKNSYINLINNKINTAIPCHYLYFDLIDNFKWKKIVETDQIKIHLYSNKTKRVVEDFLIKNNINNSFDIESFIFNHNLSTNLNLQSNLYDCHIDIDIAWDNWGYLNNRLRNLGIDLNQSVYKTYLDIKDGKTEQHGINGGTVDAADKKVYNL